MTKDEALARLERAIHAAFTGSAEHGSFFRQGLHGEYVPSVFMTLNELRRTLAAPPSPARQQCACAVPDPVMQADRRFYCHTCSFQVPAVLCERCQSIVQPSPAQDGGDLGPCRCGLATCPDRLRHALEAR